MNTSATNATPIPSAADLGALYSVLDALQPDASRDAGAATTYRPTFNDSPDSDEALELPTEADDDDYWHDPVGEQATMIGEFQTTDQIPVCAVDAGIVRLGETSLDTYVALRGSYVAEWHHINSRIVGHNRTRFGVLDDAKRNDESASGALGGEHGGDERGHVCHGAVRAIVEKAHEGIMGLEWHSCLGDCFL